MGTCAYTLIGVGKQPERVSHCRGQGDVQRRGDMDTSQREIKGDELHHQGNERNLCGGITNNK